MIYVFTSLCNALTLSLTKDVVLETQCFAVYFLENREKQRIFLKALFEVLELRVCLILLFHVTLLKLLIVVYSFDNLICFAQNFATLLRVGFLE